MVLSGKSLEKQIQGGDPLGFMDEKRRFSLLFAEFEEFSNFLVTVSRGCRLARCKVDENDLARTKNSLVL